MSIKDLKEYVINKRKAQQKKWEEDVKTYGACQPLTLKEYLKYKDIIIAGKKNHKIKFVHNRLWKRK